VRGGRARPSVSYPTRLRIAAFAMPSLLIAALLGLDYFVLDRLLGPGLSHLVSLVIGVAGVLAFSAGIFGRLTTLHLRDAAQTEQLAVLASDLEARRRQLQALNVAGMALTSELDSSAVLQKVADEARRVASARYAALGVFDDEGVVQLFVTSGLTPEERARIGPLPKGRGLLGLLQREPHPLRVAEISKHPASVGFPKGHPPMHSFLGTPILWRGRAIGNLYLTEKHGGAEFTADDEEAVQTLAAQAAIAIENARLYEQIERMAVLEERQRIGMELHDGAIQSLYGVGLLLEDAAVRLETEPEEAKAALARVVDRLNAAIADLRGFMLGLRQKAVTPDLPLTESLPRLAERTGENALIDVSVSVAEEAAAALDQTRREAAFYIAADALGNIARHARAKHASLRLGREDGRVVLEVRDDGVGFDDGAMWTGHGLRNMRDRAFAVGGTLRVESAPGQGSRIRLELPTIEQVARG